MNNFGQGLGNNFSTIDNRNFNTRNDFFSGLNVNNFPHYDIIKVSGRSGAEAFQMGPNSRYILVDDKEPLIWFVQTDGAGYKNISPYSISPYQAAPPIDLNVLESRLTALEEKVNAKSYNGTNKQRKQNNRAEQSYVSVETTDTTSQAGATTNNGFA